jgi:hypothetical protein
MIQSSQKRYTDWTSEFHRIRVQLLSLSVACVHSNTACSVAGITSDANVLTTYLRELAQWSVQQIFMFSNK